MRSRRKAAHVARKRITKNVKTISSSSSMVSFRSETTVVSEPQSIMSRSQLSRPTTSKPPGRYDARLRSTSTTNQSSLNKIEQKKRADKRRAHHSSKIAAVKKLKQATNDINLDDLKTNETVNVQPASKIKTRRVTVALDRINTETLNQYRQEKNNSRRNVSASQPVQNVATPKKIATRRCTVNLTKIDISQYQRELPPIAEQANEETAENDDQMQIEDTWPISEVSTVVFSPRMIPPALPRQQRSYSFPVEELMPDNSVEANAMDDAQSENSEPPASLLDKLTLLDANADADDEIESTHTSDIEDLTTNFSKATTLRPPVTKKKSQLHSSSSDSTNIIIPPRKQQLMSSQTQKKVPWSIHGSVSEDSLAVRFSKSSNESFPDASVMEPKKCFIDSRYISYDPFIQSGTTKFAVNHFDRSDDIEHYFLSKFCRSHFGRLEDRFNGYLHVTGTTGRSNTNFDAAMHDQTFYNSFIAIFQRVFC